MVDSVEKKWIDGWVKRAWKNVKNIDLWKRFLIISKKHHVKFVWVKGHASNVENNRCDELAVMASRNKERLVDVGYEEGVD